MGSYMGHEYNDSAATYAEARGGNGSKPVESKYRVGDRVKVVANEWGATFPVGETGTVQRVLGHGITVSRDGHGDYDWFFSFDGVAPALDTQEQRYRVGDRVRHKKVHEAGVGVVLRDEGKDNDEGKDDSGYRYYRVDYKDSRYRVCTDPEDSLQPAFRPGDRVKLNKHSGVRACGERGTVSAVIGDNVSVRMDDASVYGTVVAFFHADNLDWERVEDCVAKPEPKFKAGDRVTYVPGADMDGHFMTIKSFRGDYHEPAYWFEEGGFDVERLLMLAAPCPQDNEQPGDPLWRVRIDTSGYVSGISLPQPAIVALVNKNGKPRPSQWPHVHASVADATKEAERLARNNPGEEFAVYQRVAGRVCETTYNMKEVA